jgi:hypothetical protein
MHAFISFTPTIAQGTLRAPHVPDRVKRAQNRMSYFLTGYCHRISTITTHRQLLYVRDVRQTCTFFNWLAQFPFRLARSKVAGAGAGAEGRGGHSFASPARSSLW